MTRDCRDWLRLGLCVIGGGYIIGAALAGAVASVLVFAEWASGATEVE